MSEEPDAAPPDPLVPLLTVSELVVVRSVAASRRAVVEFGCGGSTVEWLKHPVERVVSVETDADWIERLRGEPALQEPLETGRLTLLHANIGPTRGFGRPTGRDHMGLWPAYWSDVWRSDALTDAPPVDLVFVDGRFRVAATLNAALHVDDDALILIHDFTSRDHYHVVLDHLTVVAAVDELVVLRRGAKFSVSRAVDDLSRFALVSR